MTKLQGNIIILLLVIIAAIGATGVALEYSATHKRSVSVTLPAVDESHTYKKPLKTRITYDYSK